MADAAKPKSVMGTILKVVIIILILVGAGFLSEFFFTYSEGSNAGTLVRVVKKGYVFKTYEGELNLGSNGNVSNTAQFNQIWHFSVKDESTANTLMQLEGKKVSLHYKEALRSFPWVGETHYFVDGAKEITEK